MKNISPKFATILSGLLAVTSTISLGALKEKTPQFPSSNSSFAVKSIDNHRLSCQLLKKVHNEDGSDSITMSYIITPSNATITGVSIKIAWSDTSYDGTLSDYFSSSVDESNQTFTITCKQAFDHEAKAIILSKDEEDVQAQVVLGYEKRLLKFKAPSKMESPGFYSTIDGPDRFSNVYLPNEWHTFSPYTIEKVYVLSCVAYTSSAPTAWNSCNNVNEKGGDANLHLNDSQYLGFPIFTLSSFAGFTDVARQIGSYLYNHWRHSSNGISKDIQSCFKNKYVQVLLPFTYTFKFGDLETTFSRDVYFSFPRDEYCKQQ